MGRATKVNVRFIAIGIFVAATPPSASVAADPPAATSLGGVEILSVPEDRTWVEVRRGGKRMTLEAGAPEVREALKSSEVGDVVDIRYSEGEGSYAGVLRDLSVGVKRLGVWPRVQALGLAVACLLLIFWLMLGSRLRDLVVGADNRYSKSKFQMAIWFFLLLVGYVALTGLRVWSAGLGFIGGIGIPQNLLILSGLSALSFVGAKSITQNRVDAMVGDPARVAAAGASPPSATEAVTWRKIEGARGGARPRFPHDLLHDDEGRVDLGDFQAIVVTLLAVSVYVLTVFNFLGAIQFHRLVTLPDVDSTILGAFGLGQGAYLAKKAVGDVGGGRPSAPPQAPPPGPIPQPPAQGL
jgi:hypothetical protein